MGANFQSSEQGKKLNRFYGFTGKLYMIERPRDRCFS